MRRCSDPNDKDNNLTLKWEANGHIKALRRTEDCGGFNPNPKFNPIWGTVHLEKSWSTLKLSEEQRTRA